MTEPNWTDIADHVFTRWGSSAHPTITDKTESAKLLAISIGLGCLFDGNIEAEQRWMRAPREILKGTPYNAVLQGRLDEVLDLVNRERNVW